MASAYSNNHYSILQKKIQPLFDKQIDAINQSSLDNLSSANQAVASKNSGIHKLIISFHDGTTKHLAMKTKSQQTLINGILLLSKSSPKLRIELIKNHKVFAYNSSHRREISIYQNLDRSLSNHHIKYYGFFVSFPKTYNLLFDYYNDQSESLTFQNAKRLLDGILTFHTFYYKDIESAKRLNLNIYTPTDYKNAKNCIYDLYNSRHTENLKLYGEKQDQAINHYINSIDRIMQTYKDHRTFTHNDFSTRNTFLAKNQVLFYDFELSCFQNPEHDLIEFLMYDLGSFTDQEAKKLIDYYKNSLAKNNITISNEDYKNLLIYNAYEFIVNRLSMTKTINDTVALDFAKTSIPNSKRLLKILETL